MAESSSESEILHVRLVKLTLEVLVASLGTEEPICPGSLVIVTLLSLIYDISARRTQTVWT